MSAPNRSALPPVGPAAAAEDAIAACAAPFSTPGNANRLPSTPPRRNNSRRVIVRLVIVISRFAVRSSVSSSQFPVRFDILETGNWRLETGNWLEEELQHQLHVPRAADGARGLT